MGETPMPLLYFGTSGPEPRIPLRVSMILPLQAPQHTKTIEAHVVRPQALAPTPELLATLKMPEGFHLTRYVDGISNPRIVKALGTTVYASQRTDQNIVMFKDLDGDGVADTQRVVATGTDLHGFAFTKDGKTVVMVGIRKLWRAKVLPDGNFGPKQELMDDLPDAGQHPNRTVEIGPDGRVYVSCGSTANDAVEHNPYNATIVVCDLDGKHRAILASGVRNTLGFDWQPGTNALYGWDQGIDWLGDDEQREEVNLIQKGRRYGWPFVYEDGKPDQNAHLPIEKGYTIQGWLAQSVSPVLTYTAHAAGMQMRFYRGAMFPKEYRGDAFATMHGSWNRKPPSGYEVVRVRFEHGKPKAVEPFLTGFLQDPEADRPRQFGRICGLAEMPDGSLLIGDDEHGAIYRLTYGVVNAKAARLAQIDTTKLSPDLVGAPTTLKVGLGAFGEANSEYAPGRAISPSLSVSGLPAGTRALAVAMEDPDAPTIKPVVHWLMADLAADPTAPGGGRIETGIRPGDVPVADVTASTQARGGIYGAVTKATVRYGGVQSGNSHGTVGYYGPKPPVGDKPHGYRFTVYALDAKLGMKPGFNRVALIDAMRGHVLAQGTVVGQYAKAP